MRFQKKVEEKIARFHELEKELQNPALSQDQNKMRDLGKEYRELGKLDALFTEYKKVREEIAEVEKILSDKSHAPDMLAMAQEEQPALAAREKQLIHDVEAILIQEDPMNSRNALLEIRAGTGGLEAGLFAGDLFRMYTKFAQRAGYKMELVSSSPNEAGGLKEVICSIGGQGAYGKFKFESGTHRVQRVPATETSGRIHTSAATVAVLPEAEEVDIQIKPEELRIDVFRSGGPGGQSVNTTDSAVRITHIPTGLVVSCQDEKSQLKNKQKGMKVLRARLFERAQQEHNDKMAKQRKEQVGSGDRSEKIRTYNFPDRRVTDHRVGVTSYNLEAVLDGEIDLFIDALYEQELANL